jgi:hypothetical protein
LSVKPRLEGLQPSQSQRPFLLCPGVFAMCVLSSALEAKAILQSLQRVFDLAIAVRCGVERRRVLEIRG